VTTISALAWRERERVTTKISAVVIIFLLRMDPIKMRIGFQTFVA
jgi:hypothetical protein